MLAYRPRLLAFALLAVLGIFVYQQTLWNMYRTARARPEFRLADIRHNIRNKTLGFEKIFVLAMPNRYDRQDLWSLAAWNTGIDFEYVEGVRGEDVPAKAVPVGWDMTLMEKEPNTLGCYRSHLNVMRKMVTDRVQTALIMEDDADWDVMLKDQLVEFATGSQFVQSNGDGSVPTVSPYGDDWDLLWLGHCGVKSDFRKDGFFWATDNDPTVLPFEKRSYELQIRKPDTSPEGLGGNHTRLVFEAGSGLCAYAYALSLRGAQRYLYQYSVKPQAPVFDKAMSRFCGGHQSGAKCIATYPALIDQYKQAGNEARNSDRRTGAVDKIREKPETSNVVFPVKIGIESFVEDQPTFKSQYPDDSMMPEIDPQSFTMPKGRGMFITKDQFKESG